MRTVAVARGVADHGKRVHPVYAHEGAAAAAQHIRVIISEVFLAKIPLRAPRIIFIFIICKKKLDQSIQKKMLCTFEKNFTGHTYIKFRVLDEQIHYSDFVSRAKLNVYRILFPSRHAYFFNKNK